MPASYCRRDERPQFLAATTHITCAADALGVIAWLALTRRDPEAIVLVLDERHGHTIIVVDGADDPDAVVSVVELLTESLAETERPGELVVATVRPDTGPLPGDADRWLEASALAEDCGCVLLEWFVVSGDVAWCRRDLLAERPRW